MEERKESLSLQGTEDHLLSVDAKDVLNAIMEGQDICLEYTYINGYLDIRRVTRQLKRGNSGISIPVNIKIHSSEVSGDVYFGSAVFDGDVSFSSTTFREDVNFELARFSKDISFAGVKFDSSATFRASIFNGNANFNSATFGEYIKLHSGIRGLPFNRALFDSAKFNSNADFKSANFNASAFFNLANFKGNADFRSAVFRGLVDFKSAVFDGNLLFIDVVLSENTGLAERKADFSFARFNKCIVISSATFGMCVIR